jgi:SAM-dependent methyltransferase
MIQLISKTAERVRPEKFESKEEYLIFLRHLFVYEFVKGKILKNSFVLEIGCGEGYGTNLLSQNVAKIIALDVDKNTIAHASEKYGSENSVFRVYDGAKIPYENNTFDAVISFQVIEHIQDDTNYVSEIHRVLKTNGIFILTTPNRTYRLKPGQKPWNRFHIREYYPHELENILKNKFPDVKVWGIRGSDEIQRIEIKRVKQNLSIISFDPLNLRKLIPESLKSVIIKILNGIVRRNQRSKNDRGFLNRYSVKDYYVIKNNVRDSLDLLGICKK